MSLEPPCATTFEVRTYDQSFAIACWEILHQAVHAISHPNYSSVQKAAWSASIVPPTTWVSRLEHTRPFLLFANPSVESSTLIGFAELSAEGYIDCFYLHPRHQRQGGGRHLLTALTESAQTLGCKQLSVDAALTAVPFFQQFGFQWRTVNIVCRAGIPLLNVYMQKPLNLHMPKRRYR